jgi:hypothetical protein
MNADMTAELLDILRQDAPRSWLTPLAAQVEVLVDAGRNEEARRLLGMSPPGTSLTVRGIAAEDYIGRSRRPMRTRPTEADEYRKVISSFAARWPSHRRSGVRTWKQ